MGSEDTSSAHCSPRPSRAASLKIRIPQANRVTFSEGMRQSSLPSADSELSFVEDMPDWPVNDCSSISSIPDGSHMLEIDGEQVELRRKTTAYNQKQQEPNIDFELDIKVLINSGKCVLHTKDVQDEKMSSTGNYNQSNNNNQSTTSTVRTHKRERSYGTDCSSPIPPRRHNKDKSRLRYNNSNIALVDLTIFHIPGLDVKLHYQSKTIAEDTSPRLSMSDPFGPSTTKRMALKRASLFAWMTLQSIPEETIISPHILEFLEQTLEPIPTSSSGFQSNPVNLAMLESNYAAVYASFPVDVIVYFHMQPSTFRFSCLPVSRVECSVVLPSLDIVFGSKRHEGGEMDNAELDAKTASGGLR
jgi:hypothetical protein